MSPFALRTAVCNRRSSVVETVQDSGSRSEESRLDKRSSEVTLLLAELNQGKEEALSKLIPLVYAELKRLANYYLRQERPNHTLQATALVHEAYMRLAGQNEAHWENRSQFVRVAANLMRRVLVDYSRNHNAAKRGGASQGLLLEEGTLVLKGRPVDIVAIDDALDRLAKLDSQQAQLVELRFFSGLSIEEAASVLGVSTATVKRNWSVCKAWLARELKSKNKPDA